MFYKGRISPIIWNAEFIFCPFTGISYDIVPYIPVIVIIPYHMIIKTLLPNRKACFFGNCPFHQPDYRRYCRGDHWSPVTVWMYLQQQMNMVWHNYKVINWHHWIMTRYFCDALPGEYPSFVSGTLSGQSMFVPVSFQNRFFLLSVQMVIKYALGVR